MLSFTMPTQLHHCALKAPSLLSSFLSLLRAPPVAIPMRSKISHSDCNNPRHSRTTAPLGWTTMKQICGTSERCSPPSHIPILHTPCLHKYIQVSPSNSSSLITTHLLPIDTPSIFHLLHTSLLGIRIDNVLIIYSLIWLYASTSTNQAYALCATAAGCRYPNAEWCSG